MRALLPGIWLMPSSGARNVGDTSSTGRETKQKKLIHIQNEPIHMTFKIGYLIVLKVEEVRDIPT